MSAQEAAENWGITKRRVQILCSENRVEGAYRIGNMWVIPKDSKKPVDGRTIRYSENGAENERTN